MTELTGRSREWLESAALPGKTIVGTRPLSGGYRNDNLLLEYSDGGRLVLRRYRSGNRAEIEAALARRLDGVVPVPAVVAADPEGGALLLEFASGTPVDVLLATLSDDEAAAVGIAAGRTLAAIGTIRFERAGFFADGTLRPEPMGGAAELTGFVNDCLGRLAPGWGLTRSEQNGLRALAVDWAPLVRAIADGGRLVHADFNPKNLLAERTHDGWRITVLDWEFAFSGSPLADLGNVLRFGETAFTNGVLAGFGPLPACWRETARALDLFSVAEFLTRAPREPIAGDIRAAIRRMVAGG
jgi:fructokinase